MTTTLERTTIEVERKPGIIVVHLAGDLRLFGRSEEREGCWEFFAAGLGLAQRRSWWT